VQRRDQDRPDLSNTDIRLKVLTASSRRSKPQTDGKMAQLVSKDLDEVVDRGSSKDEDPGVRSTKNDRKAKALITRYVRDHHLNAVSKAGSAKVLWDHFESTYKAKSNTRLMTLLQNLNTIKKDPAEPLTKYFATARAIQSDLEAVEQEIPEAQITLAVLNGRPKDYAVVKTVLLTTVKDPTLDAILPSLLQIEQELSSEEAVPIYTARADRRQPQARQSRGPAGRQNSASRPGKDNRLCFYCKKPGHLKHECMRRDQDQKNAASTQYTVAFSATTMEQTASGQWVLGSGASKHITFSNQKLQHYRSLDPETATVVTFGNNHQAKAVGVGDFVLRTQAQQNILLRNVLHVPEASANFFSIRTATEAGAQVIFQGDSCYIKKDDKLGWKAASVETSLSSMKTKSYSRP